MSTSVEISLDARAVAISGVVSCELDGETVLLHPASSTYFGLDAVGTQIWNTIQESRTVAEIRDRLTESYDVEPGRCEQAVIRLISDLAGHGLVTITA